MPNEYPLTSFVKAFGKAYQTIDLRAALINDAGEWRVVSMIVRVKIAPEDVVKQAYQKETKGREIDFEKFKIIQRCLPFGEFERLIGGISEGLIALDDLRIVFHPLKEITELSGHLQSFTKSKNKLSILDWPILRVLKSLSNQNPYYGTLQKDADILRHIEIAGFQNADFAIKHMLDIADYTASLINLTLDLDVPARIDLIEASKKDHDAVEFRIYATTHDALKDVICNVFTWKSSVDKKFVQAVPLQKKVLANNLQCWTREFVLNGALDERERIEFQLLHNQLGYLASQDYHLNGLFRIEVRNPLFTALSLFCPRDQWSTLLVSPKGKSITSIKSDKLYEISIQWLLTCLGFRAVWLHKFEELKIDNHSYGTVDGLAYYDRESILLFVNCTLGTPSDKELGSYKEVQAYFKENVFHKTTVRLYSAVFTNITERGNRQRITNPNDVRIFYREDIVKLLELIEMGHESRFIDIIHNPGFLQL